MLREQILVQLTYIKGPIRDLVRSMHIIFVTVACIAATLIAGTAPVRAQTLPVYDVDAETAKCLTQAETGKQWMDALKSWCRSIGQDEHQAHDQLAERWESYDKGKRTSCVADKRIADYSSLKTCVERAGTEKPQEQQQAKATTDTETNDKAYLAAIREGNAAYSAGSFGNAIASFNLAIRLHPDDASAFNSRGNAYARTGNLYRAIADYNEAIRLKPNFAAAFCNRGLARQKLNGGRDNDDKAKARQLDASACR
jgi:tetratricopeptide (TPR) repeat protein